MTLLTDKLGHLALFHDELAGVASAVPMTIGTPGADVIEGTSGDDIVSASSGDDSIFGHDGADRISGGSGNDLIEGDDFVLERAE